MTSLRRRSAAGRVTCAIAASVLISGCALPDRINHRHSDENLERAEAVDESFEAVRSDRSGLPAKIMANLATQQRLRSEVAAESHRYFDLINLQATENLTWRTLRKIIFNELGWEDDLWRDNSEFLVGLLGEISTHTKLGTTERESLTERATLLGVLNTRLRGSRLLRLRNDRLEAPFDELVEDLQKIDERYPKMSSLSNFDLDSSNKEIKSKLQWPSLGAARAILKIDADDDRVRIEELLQEPVPGPDDSSLSAIIQTIEAGGDPANPLIQQIGERLNLLRATMKTYEVLIKGERARLSLLQKHHKLAIANARKKLTTSENDTGSTESAEATATAAESMALSKLLGTFQAGLKEWWEKEEIRSEYRDSARGLQKLLLAAGSESRDPASVYSLVPLAGEGLRTDDLNWLRRYLAHLEALLPKEGKCPEDLPSQPKPGANASERLRHWECQLKAKLLAKKEKKETEGAEETEDGAKMCSEDARGPSEELLCSIRQLRGLLSKVTAADKEIGARKPWETAKELFNGMKQIQGVADKLGLDLAITSGSDGRAELAKLIVPLQTAIQGKSLNSEQITSLLKIAIGPLAEMDNFEVAEDDVDHIESILGDISSESEQASKRIIELLGMLYDLHEQMRGESARHYLALTVVASSEVERWVDIGSLAEDLENLMVDDKLFADRSTVRGWNKKSASPEPPKNHRFVETDNDVITSIRRLAATASFYQTGDPELVDPTGKHTRRSAERLTNAFRILHGYHLLSTVNRRRAAENSIQLIGEVREHALRVDDIVISGVEAQIDYGLDRLVAFHATGVTQRDVEVFVSLVQTGLLAWIGVGAN